MSDFQFKNDNPLGVFGSITVDLAHSPESKKTVAVLRNKGQGEAFVLTPKEVDSLRDLLNSLS